MRLPRLLCHSSVPPDTGHRPISSPCRLSPLHFGTSPLPTPTSSWASFRRHYAFLPGVIVGVGNGVQRCKSGREGRPVVYGGGAGARGEGIAGLQLTACSAAPSRILPARACKWSAACTQPHSSSTTFLPWRLESGLQQGVSSPGQGGNILAFASSKGSLAEGGGGRKSGRGGPLSRQAAPVPFSDSRSFINECLNSGP